MNQQSETTAIAVLIVKRQNSTNFAVFGVLQTTRQILDANDEPTADTIVDYWTSTDHWHYDANSREDAEAGAEDVRKNMLRLSGSLDHLFVIDDVFFMACGLDESTAEYV